MILEIQTITNYLVYIIVKYVKHDIIHIHSHLDGNIKVVDTNHFKVVSIHFLVLKDNFQMINLMFQKRILIGNTTFVIKVKDVNIYLHIVYSFQILYVVFFLNNIQIRNDINTSNRVNGKYDNSFFFILPPKILFIT